MVSLPTPIHAYRQTVWVEALFGRPVLSLLLTLNGERKEGGWYLLLGSLDTGLMLGVPRLDDTSTNNKCFVFFVKIMFHSDRWKQSRKARKKYREGRKGKRTHIACCFCYLFLESVGYR